MGEWGILTPSAPLLGFHFPMMGLTQHVVIYSDNENTWISELRFTGQTEATGEDGSHLSYLQAHIQIATCLLFLPDTITYSA